MTKALLDDGSTRWAQGGIAAALGPDDRPRRTCATPWWPASGCATRPPCACWSTEGPAAVRELIALGAAFDRDPDGALRSTREGGHLATAIVHAGGDATGAEVQRALLAAVAARRPGDRADRARAGARPAARTPTGRAARRHAARARRGHRGRRRRGARPGRSCSPPAGWARSSPSTTNPIVSTGDGVALGAARRRGGHRPGVRAVPPDRAVARAGRARPAAAGHRGACAARARVLVDGDGDAVHGRACTRSADLAPRDVVAKAITAAHARDRQPTTSTWTPAQLGAGPAAHAVPDDRRPAAARPASTR